MTGLSQPSPPPVDPGTYQPLDSDLTAIAALSTTAFGRSLLALADAAAGRTALGLGTAALSASGDFQPVDSDLTAIAALATTSYGRAFLALADGAALRAVLGTGTPSSSNFLRGDGTWSAASSSLMIPGPIPVSGRFLQAPPLVLTVFNSNTFTDQIMYAVPVPIWSACTLNSLLAYVNTTGSGGTVRLGLYGDDGFGNPSSLLVDAGTFSGTGSGQQEIAISLAITAPRLLWAVAVYQGAPVTPIKLITTYTDYRLPIIPSGSKVNVFQNLASGSNQQVGWKSSAVIGSGALPGTFPAKTAITEQYVPIIGIGVA